MRFQVTQRRGTSVEEIVLHETRRYNGAVTLRQIEHESALAHLREHAHGERVVEGPGVEDSLIAARLDENREYLVVTTIRRKVRR